jgi:Tfp pilus assembly protein PilF
VSDIFVSYTSSDRDWAHWIARELEALGHVPHIHEWEIKGGDDIYAWMERRHDAADHVLCVVSDEYLKAPYSTPPGRVFAVSNVPVHVPVHFMGRDDALAAIEIALGRYGGRVAVTALHGLRGVGKTTLAAAYCERHRGDYRATWWVRAQTEPTMRADLAALGVRLGWVAPDDKEEPALTAVGERLRQEGEGILLIFDNAIDADSLRPYLPKGGAVRVIVTSNRPNWRSLAEPVEIKPWSKNIGADYLIKRTGRGDERAAAEELSEALGGLPLAHEQAASYCERLEVPLAEYHKRFDAEPTRLLNTEKDAPAEYHDQLTVAKTFSLAIDEAAKLHPAAEPLIVYASLLAPEPIPLFLFTEVHHAFAEPLASALTKPDGLDEIIAALRAFALIDREMIADERDPAIATDTIRLHRLVRQVAAARRDAAAQEAMRATLIAVMAAIYRLARLYDSEGWPRARRLDTLAIALVGEGVAVPAGAEAAASLLLDRLATYRQNALAAYHPEACALFEWALATAEKALGPGHPVTAAILNNLAGSLRSRSDISAALALHERALAIAESIYGSEHPITASALSNLARVLREKGCWAEAQQLAERALAIRERVLGPEHASTATSFITLAGLLQEQDDLSTARSLLEHALAIRENALGPTHPDTAYILNELGKVLKAQGDVARARSLFERALAICEAALSPGHPELVITLSNLAELLDAEGNREAAGALRDRILTAAFQTLCFDDPDAAARLDKIAMLRAAQGRPTEAQSLFERALVIREKVLGSEHPETAQSLNNLACLLREIGHSAEAEPLFRRAIAIGEKTLGRQHPDVATRLSNLACLLRDSGRRAEALTLAEAALAAYEKAFGPSHPRNMDSARIAADALAALGRSAEAAALRARYGLG